MKFSIFTLGCKVNQYESEVIAESFRQHGYDIVSSNEATDVFCINTCAVTEESVRKSRQIIRRFKRNNPNAVIIVCGCVPQTNEKIVEADILIGNKDKSKLPNFVDLYRNSGEKIILLSDISKETEFEKMNAKTGERTRATLKIQDGCNNFCSYCIIPFARGNIRSKPLDEAVSEAKELVFGRNKYKEIVLAGIHLDNYGKENGEYDLIDLLEKLDEIEGLERIRLGSLEPVFITSENVRRLMSIKKLCPQFHISLQSGCEETLFAMNRHYTPQIFSDSVGLLRKSFEGCAITTDIIVGFPGETEENFEESLDFTKKMKFAKIHVFPYSERKGTKAAEMDGKVDNQTKSERCKIMLLTARESEVEFYRNLVGKTGEVLTETYQNGIFTGRLPNYAEIHIIASDKNDMTYKKSQSNTINSDIINTIKTVKITKAEKTFAFGEILE